MGHFRKRRRDRRRLLTETLESRRLLAADGPTIDQIIINDGLPQRSSLTSVDVVFDSLVTIDSGASPFQFSRTSDGATADVVSTQVDGTDGRSTVRLEFANSDAVVDRPMVADTLAVGSYYFVIDSNMIHDGVGQPLDGNSDGHAGDHFVYQGDDLYRMFGDFRGDRQIDLGEFTQFRGRFASSITDAGGNYDESFDYNGDGNVNLVEFTQFRQTFGQSMETATAQTHQWVMSAGESRTLDLAIGAIGFDLDAVQVSMIDGVAVTTGDTVQTAAGMVTVGQQGRVELAATSDFDGTAGFTYTLFDSAMSDTAEVDFAEQPIIQIEIGPGETLTLNADDEYFNSAWPVEGFFRDATRTTTDPSWQRVGISATILSDDIKLTVAKGVAAGTESIRFLIDHPDGLLPGEINVTITDPEVEITTASDSVTLQAGTHQVIDPLANDSAIEIGASEHDPSLRLVGISFDPAGTFDTSAVVDNVRATIRRGELIVAATTDATVSQTLYYQVDAGTTARATGQIDLSVTPFTALNPLSVVFVSGNQANAPLPLDTPVTALHGFLGLDPDFGGDGQSITTQAAVFALSEDSPMLHFTRTMPQAIEQQSVVVQYTDSGSTPQYGYINIQDVGDATLWRSLALSTAQLQSEITALPNELAAAGWSIDGLVASDGSPVAFIVDGQFGWNWSTDRLLPPWSIRRATRLVSTLIDCSCQTPMA